MAPPYHRRRIHYIKKDFQLRFILKFCLLVLLGAVVSTGVLSLLSQGTLTSSFHDSRLVIERTAVAILPAVIYTNLITLGLITLATVFVTLYASHKLAGPMFRFESDLRAIGEGDLTKVVRLRRKDQLVDMVASINAMREGLHARVAGVCRAVDHLEAEARTAQAPPEVMAAIDRLRERIDARFRLDIEG